MAIGETLNLRMYDFLIRPIRYEDATKGNHFVQRFLQGGQQEWEDFIARMFSVKKLWSVTECPDEYLQYLKWIVGWTPDLDHITNQLDYDALRRLISSSVALWKSRTTEGSIVDALNVIVPARSRIWNWFDFRWVTGETIFSEQRDGRDPWMISMPNGDKEYWSNIRVVDPGSGFRQLLRDTIRIMRPLGERYTITYLRAFDLFTVEGDNSQWDTETGPDPVIEEGVLKLADDTVQQMISLNTEDSDTWDSYIVYTRVHGSEGTSSQKGFGLAFYLDPSTLNGYFAILSVKDNTLLFGTLTGGTLSVVTTFDYDTVPYLLQPDVPYGIRIQVIPESATNRIRIYVNGVERINTTSTHRDEGTVGLMHTDEVTSEFDELEVLGLPVDTETIEINS